MKTFLKIFFTSLACLVLAYGAWKYAIPKLEQRHVTETVTEPTVLICMGPYAKAYHKTRDCIGIQACSKEIREVTVKEAENLKRHPCSKCY